MPSVVRPCWCSFLTTLHIGAPEEGFLCSSCSLPLHALSSLTANRCCLESKIAGAWVSPDSLISAPLRVVGSAPRMDLACRFMGSWRLSRLPNSLGSHQRSLPYSATAWAHATWTARTLSGTTPYVLVRVQSVAFAALVFFMHRLCCSLNVRCASIQTPSQCVACVLIRMTLFPTLIFAVNFGQRCFLWPRLRVNSAASIFVVSNCSHHLPAHLLRFAALLSSIETTWLISLPVATQPRSSTKDRPWASDMYHSTHLISPEVLIAKRIGDTGEPCGTPASTGCLSLVLPSITISTVLSDRELSFHHIRSPSIFLTFVKLTSHPLATLGKAALMSMRSTPVMWPFVQAAWALSTMMAAASMADRPFLLPNCPSLSNPHLSGSSDSSSAATFSTTFPIPLSTDM